MQAFLVVAHFMFKPTPILPPHQSKLKTLVRPDSLAFSRLRTFPNGWVFFGLSELLLHMTPASLILWPTKKIFVNQACHDKRQVVQFVRKNDDLS